MNTSEIKDRDSLEAWLTGRPKRDVAHYASTIAERAVLRLLPLALSARKELSRDFGDLQLYRVLVTATAESRLDNSDIEQIVRVLDRIDAGQIVGRGPGSSSALMVFDSALLLNSLRRNPNDAIRLCLRAISVAISSLDEPLSISTATYARFFSHDDSPTIPHPTNLLFDAANDCWSAIREDCTTFEKGGAVKGSPLWHGSLPGWILLFMHLADQIERKPPDDWSFWTRWWDGVLSGNQLDWDLQRQVALIPDEIWQQGPAAVAEAIRQIEAEQALVRTDNAETISPNPETGYLRIVPGSAIPADIAVYARRKITNAVALFDDPSCQQMYGSLAADLAMLRQSVEDAANLPVELFDACASATRRLVIRAANGECPPPEKDPVLSDYQSRLREVAADILAHDPQTQSVLERRNAITGNNALIDAAAAITMATAEIVPITEGHLATALQRDVALVTDIGADAEDRKVAAYRWAGRVLRIGKWVIGCGSAAIISTAALLEAIPIIQSSPYFQLAREAILRWLGLG